MGHLKSRARPWEGLHDAYADFRASLGVRDAYQVRRARCGACLVQHGHGAFRARGAIRRGDALPSSMALQAPALDHSYAHEAAVEEVREGEDHGARQTQKDPYRGVEDQTEK